MEASLLVQRNHIPILNGLVNTNSILGDMNFGGKNTSPASKHSQKHLQQ